MSNAETSKPRPPAWRPVLARRAATLALCAVASLAPVRAGIAITTTESLPTADAVLVVKSERKLYLLREGQPFRSYRIALGLNPNGHKEREGDYRTPEGRYELDMRNPRSEFFLSIRVSYPNDRDVANARRQRARPGGAIMIHGLPNVPKRSPEYYRRTDWTDGCIALSNDDMLEVWLLTRPYTPIEIRP
jgi:murein L,D-transpeptidase YafK